MVEKEYIEREAAIDALTERNLVVHMDSVNDGLVASCHRSAQRIIANLPAADVRPAVRGRWIPDYDYTEYDIDGSTLLPEPREFQDGWQCSLCGGYTPSEANYCPNCGASMREES